MYKKKIGERIFDTSNTVFLVFIMLLCIFPVWNVLMVSFSSSGAAAAGRVNLLPVEFNLNSYEYVFTKPEYFRAFFITVERTILGLAFTMLITIITAFPLSKEVKDFPQRTVYTWFFFITLLFGGGLIPYYMVISKLHLTNTIWVLVIPHALNVWNTILVLNFMRGLPKEVAESAYVDGAGNWSTLWHIIVPMSKPVLATIFLFTAVGHWNSWFDGLIFISEPSKYPLQTYLQSVVVLVDMEKIRYLTQEQLEKMSEISNRTFKSAQIFISIAPIMCIYPFLQKYFVKGIVLGSVKE